MNEENNNTPNNESSDNSFKIDNLNKPVGETPPSGEYSSPSAPGTEPSSEIHSGNNSANVFTHSAPGGKPTKLKKVLLTALLVLIVAIAGVADWLLFGNQKASAPSESASEPVLESIDSLTLGSVEGPASVFFPDEGLLGLQVMMDHQVYEGLTSFENNKPVPLLAQSWTNPDQNTWIFKLKPNVKFHTGKALTAKEVKASLDDLSKYDYWSLFVKTIESVEATGDLEVTIKTKKPDALLLNRLAQAYISDLSAPKKAGANGTGAFKLDETAKNDEKSTTLIAFDGYHGEAPKTKKLVIVVYESDDANKEALKKGEIDILETLRYPDVKTELTGAGFTANEYEAPGSLGLYMNQVSGSSVLKNKDIRSAIALAMDRQALVDKLARGNITATQIIPSSLPGYDASLKWPALDKDAAKAALKKAGYKNEPLNFAYIDGIQEDAPILILQLKAIGLNVVEKAYSADEIGTALDDLGAGKFDLFASAFTSDFVDARDVLGGILHSKESSYPSYASNDFNDLLADSDAEFDPTKRIALLQQAQKHAFDELAWIPLRNSAYASYYKSDLSIKIDYNGGGSMGTYYRNVGRVTE